MTRFCVGGIQTVEWTGTLSFNAADNPVSVYRLELCWDPVVAVTVQLFRYPEQGSGGTPRAGFSFDDIAATTATCILATPDSPLADHISPPATGPAWDLDAQGNLTIDLEANPIALTGGHSLLIQTAPVPDTFTLYYEETDD